MGGRGAKQNRVNPISTEKMAEVEAEQRVERLWGRVDEIAARLNEGPKPWYRQTNVLIATIAAVVSITSATFSMVHQTRTRREAAEHGLKAEEQGRLEKLRSIVMEITAIDERTAQAATSLTPDPSGYFTASLWNAKRQLLLDEAEMLLRQFDEAKSGSQPEAALQNLVAWQLLTDGRVGDALSRFKRVAESTRAKGSAGVAVPAAYQVALTSLAQLHMLNTAASSDTFDMEQGRKYWMAVLKSIGESPLPDAVQRRAETFLKWAQSEYCSQIEENGLPGEAAKRDALARLEDARTWFNKLKPGMPAREAGLMQVVMAERSIRNPLPDFFADEAVFPGRCLVRFPMWPTRSGEGVVVWTDKTCRVFLSESVAGRPVATHSGTLTFVDTRTVVLEWIHSEGPVPVQGVTQLVRLGSGTRFAGNRLVPAPGGSMAIPVEFEFNLDNVLPGSDAAVAATGS